MVLVQVTARTAVSYAAVSWPTHGPLQRNTGLVVVLAVVLLWSGIDALREDLHDDHEDLTVRWLKAGVLAGPVAGLLGWAVQALFIDAVGTSQLAGNIIGGGAFTALLIVVPALFGVMFGHFVRPDRKAERAETRQRASV